MNITSYSDHLTPISIASSGHLSYIIDWSDSSHVSFSYSVDGPTTKTKTWALAMPFNSTHHYAFVRDGTNLDLYFDGIKQGVMYNIGTDSLFFGWNNPLTLLGAGYNGQTDNYSMDEIRISDIARWHSNFVVPTSEYSQVIPTIIANNTVGIVSYPVQFTSLISGGSISSYNWSFGDGTFSTIQNPIHIYSTYGSFQTVLTVYDSDAAYNSNIINITAYETPMLIFKQI
jgi:hypothetical protein